MKKEQIFPVTANLTVLAIGVFGLVWVANNVSTTAQAVNQALAAELVTLQRGDLVEDTHTHEFAMVSYTTPSRNEVVLYRMIGMGHVRVVAEVLAMEPVRTRIIRRDSPEWASYMRKWIGDDIPHPQ